MAQDVADKKTRGPMSEDARIVQAKRKVLELGKDAQALAILRIGSADTPDLDAAAAVYEDAARVLRFAAPLSPDGRRTLLALVK